MKSYRPDYLLLGLLGLLLCPSAFAQPFAASSVLSQGVFYKLSVSQTGIHRINVGLLNSLGLQNVPASRLQIYANRGGMLPQANNVGREDDLTQLPLWVRDLNGDGVLNANDEVLFYMEGPHGEVLNSQNRFLLEQNLYDDANYCFLTVGTTDGLRITDQSNPDAAGPSVVTAFDDYAHFEEDLESLIESGREWFGFKFGFVADMPVRNFDISGILPGSQLQLTVAAMAQCSAPSTFQCRANGTVAGQLTMPVVPPRNTLAAAWGMQGHEVTRTFEVAADGLGNNLALNISYQRPANNFDGIGFLKYANLNFRRALRLYGSQTRFRALESRGHLVTEYRVEQANASQRIWDITQPLSPKNQAFVLSGTHAVFRAVPAGNLRTFVVFDPSANLPAPSPIGAIPNQNLHGLATPNLLIVTTPEFGAEADRLAAHRRTQGLTVEVVRLPQIYHEFGSGRQDVTAIRDFVRMLYLRAPQTLRYLLLFGDASYDYKNRLPVNTNFVPTYQSRESLHNVASYCSDDYYGLLETNEGYWSEDWGGVAETVEIGIGRLPIDSPAEAKAMVDKLIHYDLSRSTLGVWRSQTAHLADDADGHAHLFDADRIVNRMDTISPIFSADKIYIAAYNKEISSIGVKRSPIVRNKIDNRVRDGVLVMSYMGHGSELGLADENVVDIPEIIRWTNLNNLPLLTAATCEFGRFDDPLRRSGAEMAVVSGQGGMIGVIGTTRPVFSFSNYYLAEALYDVLFKKENGAYHRLGDIMRITKNNSILGVNNRNFSLLCDPSMRLAYPQDDVVLTQLNGRALTQSDTLRALQRVRLAGEVRRNGALAADFNGVADIRVLDKKADVRTTGQEDPTTTFQEWRNLLYQGRATVRGGRFEVEFVVPRDIVYAFGRGRVFVYAAHDTEFRDAAGTYTRLIIGGSANQTVVDDQPPLLKLFLHDSTFANGGVVAPNALMTARLSDDNGINFSGTSVGHDITAVIDGDESRPYILNEFYRADVDNFRKGTVQWRLPDLAPGRHTLRFKAWDTFNNSVTAEISFVIAGGGLVIQSAGWVPNPFQDQSVFAFSHNHAGADLDVSLHIYNLLGMTERVISRRITASPAVIQDLVWNGTGNSGAALPNGTYICRIEVRSLRDDSVQSLIQKVILSK